MTMERICEAAKSNDIDSLLMLASDIPPESAGAAVAEYERYYNHELAIACTLQDILAKTKMSRTGRRLPTVGSYSYNLE